MHKIVVGMMVVEQKQTKNAKSYMKMMRGAKNEQRSDTVKAILVIEMPSRCEECNFQQYGICHALRKCITGTPKELKSKPNWCPLRPAPEKRHSNDNLMELLADIVRNACIDEILGDKE